MSQEKEEEQEEETEAAAKQREAPADEREAAADEREAAEEEREDVAERDRGSQRHGSLGSRSAARWEPRPLGPASLLWRYGGDRRLALTGLSAGILQLLHPAIGAGVAEHSDFFADPWDRILRSIPQILGVIYDPEAEALGRRVRRYHRRIKGVDHRGRRYDALAPATFWWAHATFQHAVKQIVDRFDHHRLSPEERESLYLDGVEWYRRYGVSMRPVPADYAAFRQEWRRYCQEVLEMTPAAERVIDLTLHARSQDLPFLPEWTRPVQPHLVTPLLRLTAVGGLPDQVRKRFGIPWRLDQEAEYRALQLAVRQGWRWVLPSRRYGPVVARSQHQRAAS